VNQPRLCYALVDAGIDCVGIKHAAGHDICAPCAMQDCCDGVGVAPQAWQQGHMSWRCTTKRQTRQQETDNNTGVDNVWKQAGWTAGLTQGSLCGATGVCCVFPLWRM
jgi:hypothetical protein